MQRTKTATTLFLFVTIVEEMVRQVLRLYTMHVALEQTNRLWCLNVRRQRLIIRKAKYRELVVTKAFHAKPCE